MQPVSPTTTPRPGSAYCPTGGIPLPPSQLWLNRSTQIRSFILLYRECAVEERNAWARAFLDSCLESLDGLSERAETERRHEC